MTIRVTGLNHHTAPVQVREALAFPRNRIADALAALRERREVDEAVVLSTCNRVEVYVCGRAELDEGVVPAFLAEFHGVWPETFAPHLYHHVGADAVGHLFRVASGLDSLVVGEAQITGQVKQAYEAAAGSGASGVVLHRLFQQALSVAKQVRTRTEIGAGRASIGSVAVELAGHIFESLAGRTVLVVGAGEMGEAVVRSLHAAGASALLVANRTFTRAEELAREWGGTAVHFDRLTDSLSRADIVITSTDAPHHVIRRADVAEALRARRNRPVFVIDIGVPRNVEPSAAEVEGCYLYNVDHLQAVVAETLALRRREVEHCMAIVEAEVGQFMAWLAKLALAPTITELSQRFHELKRQELAQLWNKLPDLPEPARAEIERMANRVVNKILHQPITALQESPPEDHPGGLLAAALRLFGLSRGPTTHPPAPTSTLRDSGE